MENLNISQYINKVTGDSISAEAWNGVFAAIQSKVNELVEAYNDTPQPEPEVSSLYVNGVLHEETGVLTLNAQQTYTLSGKYYGQIVVNATGSKPSEDTRIRLNGVTIISDQNYGIMYQTPTENKGYKDLIVTLEKDSENFIICNKVEATASDQPGAIYSMNNLRIQGVGYLAVYNKGGHGVRGTEVLIAGPHMYVNVEHDGVHGKKVAIDDGYFYFYKATDGFGTGENGHIEWYHGKVYEGDDYGVGTMFDSKLTGIKMENIPGYGGLLNFVDTLAEGTAVGYVSQADYKADTNSQPLIVDNNKLIPATGISIAYENTGEYIVQTASVSDEAGTTLQNVWCFDRIGTNILNDGRLLYKGSAESQSTFNVYCGNYTGADDDLTFSLTQSNVSLENIFSVFSQDETYNDKFVGHYVTLSDGSEDTDGYFTLQKRVGQYYDYVQYIKLSGQQVYELNVPDDKIDNYPGDLDVTLDGAYIPGMIYNPEIGRIKIKALKDTINAIINKTQDEDAVKSENNVSIEVGNGGHLYIRGYEDGIDGGDVKITDTKGSLVVTGCGARGIKGNAIVIGPNAVITKSVITSYVTDTTSEDYKDLQGVVVVKDNTSGNKDNWGLIDPADETTIKGTGFADIYARQGKKVAKGDFGTTNAELKGVLIAGSIYGTIKVDLGNATNLYYNEAKVGVLNNEGTVINDPGKTLEEYTVIPYSK